MGSKVSRGTVRAIARKHGIDPNVFVRQIRQESGFEKRIGSSAGAQGPAQLMPGTARGLGVNINDPRQNLEGGAKYLKQQLQAFGGDYEKALRAYNAGPGAVERSRGYGETNHYIDVILGGYKTPRKFGSKIPEPKGRSKGGKPSKGKRGGSPGTPGIPGTPGTPDTLIPGQPGYTKSGPIQQDSQARAAAAMEFLQKRTDLKGLAQNIRGIADQEEAAAQVFVPGEADSTIPGVKAIPGTKGTPELDMSDTPYAKPKKSKPKKERGGKLKIEELFYDNGINLDNGGQRVGAIGGHGTHNHVSFGSEQSRAAGVKLAKKLGLTVTSEGGGKHAAGSFHYRKFPNGRSQAVDFGGPPAALAKFNKQIAARARR